MFFDLISSVMDIHPMRGNCCTIADIVGGTPIDVRSCFYPRNIPFQTSFVFLTSHYTFLTARGQQVSLFLLFSFFAMVSKC